MALIAGLAMAQVQSANTVGFSDAASISGYNWVALDFTTIGQNSGTLGGIVLDDSVTGYENNVQILGTRGNTLVMYYWVTEDDEVEVDGVDGYYVGWVDGSDEPAGDVVLARGNSVLVSTKNANTTIRRSGEVQTNVVTVSSASGYNFVGNPYPINSTLGHITLDDSVTGYENNVQYLGPKGNTLVMYYWVTEDDEVEVDGVDGYYVGWVDGGDEPAGDVTLAAGEGVLVSTKGSGTAITISPNL